MRCLPHGARRRDVGARVPVQNQSRRQGDDNTLEEEFNQYRQIFTDGRKLPVEPNPAWFGYSVGKWDGDTFVVDTTGFNDGAGLITAVTPTRMRCT